MVILQVTADSRLLTAPGLLSASAVFYSGLDTNLHLTSNLM
jgi:hypothetical protein